MVINNSKMIFVEKIARFRHENLWLFNKLKILFSFVMIITIMIAAFIVSITLIS
jgi:hypothetical protein